MENTTSVETDNSTRAAIHELRQIWFDRGLEAGRQEAQYVCPKYKDMTPEQKAWEDKWRHEQTCPPFCPHVKCPKRG